ncbi:PREDICTED: phenolic glucoside malonyltransferase [Prunus dulcis]|uniref:PREDICTED: phenolic glucoside malonyltransferase n=1 Tax=Prunus dulcis TaxID=3755 RepID=A0A5E4FYG6_PRUDU|nr:PREDICTED: phenolic glucoside malonyltransferase [Prunus dulcis]
MAEPTSSVKVVEVCRVAPPPPSSSGAFASPSSLPLTFFDIRWLRFAPVQRLFFYEMPTSSATPLFFDSILVPKLKASLSYTLQHFLPLAGNLTWPQDSQKPVLNYVQGDTVSLTIAESGADFYHLSTGDFVEATEYHPLVPRLEASHKQAAVMALQITVFPNCGFSIGTSIHHAVLDGKSTTFFLKSWAHICKHDDQSNSDPAELGTIYSNDYRNKDGPNNRSLMFWEMKLPPDSIRGTFEFTRADIETLRQSFKAKMAEQRPVHVSTFTLACAYTWVCVVKAEDIKADKARCIPVAETKGLLGEDGLVVAVNAISEAIERLKKGVLDGAENWVSRLFGVRSDERILSIAGSNRFGNYDTDFGWGRPKKFEIVSIDRTRAISLSDSKTGAGAIEVGLALDKHDMHVFASLFAKGLRNL